MKAKNRITAYALCLLVLLALCLPARAQWTEPVPIPGGFGLLSPRAVAVADTLHVVAKAGIDIYYCRSVKKVLTTRSLLLMGYAERYAERRRRC